MFLIPTVIKNYSVKLADSKEFDRIYMHIKEISENRNVSFQKKEDRIIVE